MATLPSFKLQHDNLHLSLDIYHQTKTDYNNTNDKLSTTPCLCMCSAARAGTPQGDRGGGGAM